MSDKVSIKDLDRAAVLAVAYNSTAPLGLGFLQAKNGPPAMRLEEARVVLEQGSGDPGFSTPNYHGYVFGRKLELDLSGDMVDPTWFDNARGTEGVLAQIIERLRQTGDINPPESVEMHRAEMVQNLTEPPLSLDEDSARKAADGSVAVGGIYINGIPESPDGSNLTSKQYLNWVSDIALGYYDQSGVNVAITVFLYLVGEHPGTAWIVTAELTVPMLMLGAEEGRSKLEYMMKGFSV